MQVETSVTLNQCHFCQEEDSLESFESEEYNEITEKPFLVRVLPKVRGAGCGARGPCDDDKFKSITGWQDGVPRSAIFITIGGIAG